MPMVQKKSDVTAPALFPNDTGPGSVCRHLRYIAKAAPQALKQLRVERRSGPHELVVVPGALLAGPDQSRPAQVREVPRYGGLGQLQDFNQVTDTQLTGLNQAQNSKADRVRKRPKHQINLRFRRRRHIRVAGLDQCPEAQVNDDNVNTSDRQPEMAR
jgi:hypothetical protein